MVICEDDGEELLTKIRDRPSVNPTSNITDFVV